MTATRKSLYQHLFSVVILGLLFAGARSMHAQAKPTAYKTLDLSAFGGFQYTKPDFGPQSNTGVTVGANVTRYFHTRVAPSLEVRGNYASGPNITEKSVLAGLRGQADVGVRYHPYANFLFGAASITYDPKNTAFKPDRGTVYSYGGGVDVDLVRNFQAKLDFQSQSINLGPNSVAKPSGGDFTLSPMLFTVGVAYRIPFRTLFGR